MSKKNIRIEVKPLTSALPDPDNANLHTERGDGMLENSMRSRGFFRPIAAAGKGGVEVIKAGNLTQEIATRIGLGEDAIFVYTDGTRPIVHVREDLDPDSDEAILLALEDNRVAQVSLNFNPEVLSQISRDLTKHLWGEQEMLDIVGVLGSKNISDENNETNQVYKVTIQFDDYDYLGEILNAIGELIQENLHWNAKIST